MEKITVLVMLTIACQMFIVGMVTLIYIEKLEEDSEFFFSLFSKKMLKAKHSTCHPNKSG